MKASAVRRKAIHAQIHITFRNNSTFRLSRSDFAITAGSQVRNGTLSLKVSHHAHCDSGAGYIVRSASVGIAKATPHMITADHGARLRSASKPARNTISIAVSLAHAPANAASAAAHHTRLRNATTPANHDRMAR